MQPAKRRKVNVEAQQDTDLIHDEAAVGGEVSEDDGGEQIYMCIWRKFTCAYGQMRFTRVDN